MNYAGTSPWLVQGWELCRGADGSSGMLQSPAQGCPRQLFLLEGFTLERRRLRLQLAVFKDQSLTASLHPSGLGKRGGQTKRQQMR